MPLRQEGDVNFDAGNELLTSQLTAVAATVPQLLGSTILAASAASISITIPAGYTHLQGIFTARQDSGSVGVWSALRLNGDSTSNYTWQMVNASGATVTAANSGGITSLTRLAVICGSGDTANYYATGTFEIGNASSTSAYKPISSAFQAPVSASNGFVGTAGGLWASTAAVTSVTLLPSTGNLVASSSLSIYGWA